MNAVATCDTADDVGWMHNFILPPPPPLVLVDWCGQHWVVCVSRARSHTQKTQGPNDKATNTCHECSNRTWHAVASAANNKIQSCLNVHSCHIGAGLRVQAHALGGCIELMVGERQHDQHSEVWPGRRAGNVTTRRHTPPAQAHTQGSNTRARIPHAKYEGEEDDKTLCGSPYLRGKRTAQLNHTPGWLVAASATQTDRVRPPRWGL